MKPASLLLPSSRLAIHKPNPFEDAWLQEYLIGPHQCVHDLWTYRFAIPILFRFKTSCFKDLNVSLRFTCDLVNDVNPYLMLPTLYGEDLWNPFMGIPDEHYDQSNETIDMHYILNEVTQAYKEKRGINYAHLAERFSLLGTMVALENFVADFDATLLDGESVERISLLNLKSHLNETIMKVYRQNILFVRDSTSKAEPIQNPFFTKLARDYDFHFYEHVICNPATWCLVEPSLTSDDRSELFDRFSTNMAAVKPDFFAQLMREFPQNVISLHTSISLPLNFFQVHWSREQLVEYLGRTKFYYHTLKGKEEVFAHFLTTDNADDIDMNLMELKTFPALGSFIGRRLIDLATHQVSNTSCLHELGVPMEDLHAGVARGVLYEDVDRMSSSYRRYAPLQQESAWMKPSILGAKCAKDPNIHLPHWVDVSYDEYKDDFYFNDRLLIFEAALRSKHYKLAVRVANRSVLEYKNYCAQIAEMEVEEAVALLRIFPSCLPEVVRRHGLMELHHVNDRFLPGRALYVSSDYKGLIRSLAESLIVDHMEWEERSLWGVMNYLAESADPAYKLPLFFAQFGVINPCPQALSKTPLSVLRQVIHGSKALQPHLYDFAMKLVSSTNHLDDRQVYWKMACLLFEDLPAAMRDDTQLVNYLTVLLRVVEDAMHPLRREMDRMEDHLFFVLKDRLITPDLVHGQVGSDLRRLLHVYQVKGTILAIQLSESSLEQTVHLYLEKAGLQPAALDQLLAVMKPHAAIIFSQVAKYAREHVQGQKEQLLQFLLSVVPKHADKPVEVIEQIMAIVENKMSVMDLEGQLRDRLDRLGDD